MNQEPIVIISFLGMMMVAYLLLWIKNNFTAGEIIVAILKWSFVAVAIIPTLVIVGACDILRAIFTPEEESLFVKLADEIN